MKERRQFVRLDARLSVSYRILPSGNQAIQSTTLNVSGGGVCVFLDDVLNPGTFLQVDVKLPERERSISFLGEVMWCERIELHAQSTQPGEPSHRSVIAGVKCIQITAEDQQELMRYVILNLQPPRTP